MRGSGSSRAPRKGVGRENWRESPRKGRKRNSRRTPWTPKKEDAPPRQVPQNEGKGGMSSKEHANGKARGSSFTPIQKKTENDGAM